MTWYMQLSLLLLGDNWQDLQLFTEKQETIRNTVVDLYARVLEFEMNCLCASASSWNNAAKHVVAWQGLPELVRELQQANEEVVKLVEENAAEKIRGELLARNRSLELIAPTRKESVALSQTSSNLQA